MMYLMSHLSSIKCMQEIKEYIDNWDKIMSLQSLFMSKNICSKVKNNYEFFREVWRMTGWDLDLGPFSCHSEKLNPSRIWFKKLLEFQVFSYLSFLECIIVQFSWHQLSLMIFHCQSFNTKLVFRKTIPPKAVWSNIKTTKHQRAAFWFQSRKYYILNRHHTEQK